MQSHFALINVLARLERFDEIIEVARHGLRIASDRSAIGYLFYRLAFAYWNCDQLELALACYRLVPRGEESGGSALEEMQGLMNERVSMSLRRLRRPSRPSARLGLNCRLCLR